MSAHSEEDPELIEAAPTVLVAGPDAAGQRLDQWLAASLGPDMSRSRVQMLIRQGAVSINGKPADETKRKMAVGESVSVAMPEPEPATPQGEAIALDVLYEDDALIVINKPAGLVVHPGAGNWTGTLVNALIHHCGDSLSGIGGVRRPGIVHRLDKETSGVMVVAKTDRAHKALSEAFADHGRSGDLERAYLALVWAYRSGRPERSMRRWPRRRPRAPCRSAGRPRRRPPCHHPLYRPGAVGEETAGAAPSLVECRLETGRTHQIRVHMAHIGHPAARRPRLRPGLPHQGQPVAGTTKGQVKAFSRQALHAWLLAFRHPDTHLPLRFEAPIPGDMEELVGGFRNL